MDEMGMVTQTELARLVGVPRSTLRRWIGKGLVFENRNADGTPAYGLGSVMRGLLVRYMVGDGAPVRTVQKWLRALTGYRAASTEMGFVLFEVAEGLFSFRWGGEYETWRRAFAQPRAANLREGHPPWIGRHQGTGFWVDLVELAAHAEWLMQTHPAAETRASAGKGIHAATAAA